MTTSLHHTDRALVASHVARLRDLAEAYREAGPSYAEPRARIERLAAIISRLAGVEPKERAA